MSGAGTKRPQPVSVEEWDDEAQAIVPGTRTTANANVAVKRNVSGESDNPPTNIRPKYNGTDSGYASKAPTVSTSSSMASSGRRRESTLILDTAIQIERERKPYTMSTTPRDADRPVPTRVVKEKESSEQPMSVKKLFCHKKGTCWVCDANGSHCEPRDLPREVLERIALQRAAPIAQPAVPKAKASTSKSKVEEAPRPPPRRLSSNLARPVSMLVTPSGAGPYSQYPVVHPGWAAPPQHPGVAFSPHPYMAPPTPVGYVQPQTQGYFAYEPTFTTNEYTQVRPSSQPKPVRRQSGISQERPVLERKPSRPSTLERAPSRPQVAPHKANRSEDLDRASMPPPPRPQHVTHVSTARPRPNRAHTYHSTISTQPQYYDEEDDAEQSDEESEDEEEPRTMMAHRQAPPSPRRPPSSWRPPAQEVPDRPALGQKSRSYSNGPNTTHVVASSRAMPRRRTTESGNPHAIETKEQAAEAYMRKRQSAPLTELTAENLRDLKNVVPRKVIDQRSESGSTNSHVTHHSSSKGSSGGRGRVGSAPGGHGHSRGTSMNISVNGYNLSLSGAGAGNGDGPPLLVDVGGVQISMNKENAEHHRKPQKQLERTPSMSSRPSRRSLTQSSLVSAATSGQRREKEDMLAIEAGRDSREYSRRSSYVNEEEREQLIRALSAKSSRQTSRSTSKVRQAADDMTTRPKAHHRASVEYSQRDEPVM